MTWVASDDFDSYSDGNLPGDNGGSGWAGAWSGSNNYQVQGTTVYQGSKAVKNSTGSGATRVLTTAISGSGEILYIAMRRAANNTGASHFILQTAGSVSRVTLDMTNGGNIVADGTTVLAGYSANTWYVLRFTLNTAGSTYTVAYSTGTFGTAGTFSADTSSINMTSTGDIGQVVFDFDTNADGFWDYISPTSPFTGAGGGTVHNLTSLGVGQ